MLERIDALIVKPDVCRFAFYSHLQRDSPSISVPHISIGWFSREHSNPIVAQQSMIYEILRSSLSPCFLIGNNGEANFATQSDAALLNGLDRCNHSDESTFHIR